MSQFDDLGSTPQWSESDKAQFEKIDHLIHKVFSESVAGSELLEIWTESLKFNPTAQPGYDLLVIGMEEGKKQFIRNLLTTIKKVQSG